MGPVAEAAGVLFSELNRLGVLGTRFLDRDSAFRSKPVLKVDPALRHRFDSAVERAVALARPHLATDPSDRNALLALTLANGLRADYTALVENRYRVALHYTRDATSYARQLLAICTDCYDDAAFLVHSQGGSDPNRRSESLLSRNRWSNSPFSCEWFRLRWWYKPSHKYLNRIKQQPRWRIPRKFSAYRS